MDPVNDALPFDFTRAWIPVRLETHLSISFEVRQDHFYRVDLRKCHIRKFEELSLVHNLFLRQWSAIFIHQNVLSGERPVAPHIFDYDRSRLPLLLARTLALKLRKFLVVLLGLFTIRICFNFSDPVKHILDRFWVYLRVGLWSFLLCLGGSATRLTRSLLLLIVITVLESLQILCLVLSEDFLNFSSVLCALFLTDIISSHMIPVVNQQLLLFSPLLIITFLLKISALGEYLPAGSTAYGFEHLKGSR